MSGDPLEQKEEDSLESRLARARELLGSRYRAAGKQQRVQVIINPAAGRDQPVLRVLNSVFQTAKVDWDVSITKAAGDARRLSQEAAQKGVDVVVVHGGDGTVMEAASGLIGSRVPFAIIPGGTANILALELGVPFDLVEACTLVVDPEVVIRTVDMGQVEEHTFILRAGVGFEAAMVEGADREMKDRLGVLAYAFSALQTLADPPVARYRLTLDGQQVETEGLACIVANSGTMGVPGMPKLTLAPTIDISDGLLDVIVVTKSDLPSIVSLVASVVGGGDSPHLQQWQVREARIEADPLRTVQVDGEILSETPVTAKVIPQAVRVMVPPVLDQE